MKHLQWLLATACMLAVCLSVSAQSGKKVKSISPEKWVKSKVWSEGLKAKPHSSTNYSGILKYEHIAPHGLQSTLHEHRNRKKKINMEIQVIY